jgi:CoA-transferase family III
MSNSQQHDSALPHRDYDTGAGGTLAGVRVLDLSRLFAGNLLTQILGDFGADVIKIEPPEGDTLRAWTTEGIATHWKVYARNKRSLCMDLRRPEAAEVIRRLVADAAMLVESFRPDVLEAMGLAPETLRAINPRLVVARISGWGQDGPYARRPGFGTVIEGFTGFASINGFPDREPVLPPMYLADAISGLYGASAATIALREAERSGRGQTIDLSLLEPLFSVLGTQAASYRLTGKVKPRTGSRSTNASPRNVYRCSDGRYVGGHDRRSAVRHQRRQIAPSGRAGCGDCAVHRAADAGGECRVLRCGGGDDRADQRHRGDHGRSACRSPGAACGVSGPGDGLAANACGGAEAGCDAGEYPHAGAGAGRAQPGGAGGDRRDG